MPLPKKKLSARASKKAKRRRMQTVMHDLKHGPHHKDRTRAQEIRIAMESSGQSRGGKRKKKRATSKTTRRHRRTSRR
jgi:hypothetical protein